MGVGWIAVLKVQGLRHRWPGQSGPGLDVPVLEVAAGEFLFVMGPSGSGKSTLLSALAGVLQPQSGEVSLLGRTWRDLGSARRDQHRADHVGYIFQQFNLLPYLSVWDNVMLPCCFSAVRAERAGGKDGVSQWLSALDLPPALWSRAAGALSVGQQQRVACARALVGRPELVIADEPTSALDEALRDRFMALLLQACRAAGSALVLVSHDPRLAEYATRRLELVSPQDEA